MTDSTLTCSQKMSQCAAGVHLVAWLRRADCRVSEPEQANMFLFPMYDTCYGMPGCKSSGQEKNASCLPDDFDPAAELPYFARSNGMDHIFIFACNLHAFTDRIMQRLRHKSQTAVRGY